jgi:hypothetical protein
MVGDPSRSLDDFDRISLVAWKSAVAGRTSADEHRSLGALAFSLGEGELRAGKWSDAMSSFSEGAWHYTQASTADAIAGAYRSAANALRAAGL